MKAIIKNTKIEDDFIANEKYLDVEFEIIDGDRVIETRKLRFDISASEDEIKEQIRKYVDVYEQDLRSASERALVEEKIKRAESVLENLQNREI